MIEAESNHCRIVAASLTGQREVDDQTFSSLAVLAERLERLKEQNEAFSGIAFSSAARQLRTRAGAVTVG